MFSIIFPGQGSQIIGMAREFYDNFGYVKDYFKQADEILNKKLSKIILEGPKESLDLTENTQPSIFLVSFSIFKVLERESKLDVKNAKYYAGHSLGEYSALCCAESIDFIQTIELLKFRGKAMQNAVPKGEGGMIAVLGQEINDLKKAIVLGSENKGIKKLLLDNCDFKVRINIIKSTLIDSLNVSNAAAITMFEL